MRRSSGTAERQIDDVDECPLMVDRWLIAIRPRLGSNFSRLRHLKRIICPDVKRCHRGKEGPLQSVQSIAALNSSMLDAMQPRVQPPR